MMHRLIRDRLEEVLAQQPELTGTSPVDQHLNECRECSEQVAAMREQATLLRDFKARAEMEPQPGFYARVMERIEAQGVASIWSLFFESPFGRRIAVASMALALLLGVYLVTTERSAEPIGIANQPAQMLPGEDQPALTLGGGTPDRDSVLVNLVTYQGQ